MNSLFKQYSSKTRIEFVMSVLGEVIQNNKFILEKREEQVIKLQKDLLKSKEILSGLIKNQDNSENKSFWLSCANQFLQN